MELQRGNVETNEGDRPAATLTLEEFREQFTEEHRSALVDAIFRAREQICIELGSRGTALVDIGRRVDAETKKAREALRLISQLHPPPYAW